MNLTIASGKGGTGKTFVATNLAFVMGAAYVDADVEGANGHLFLTPEVSLERAATIEVPQATDACTGCGACARACRFGAIAALKTGVLVFNELCHSCGVCLEVCPEGALVWARHRLGTVRAGTYRDARGAPQPFADGELAIGQVRASAVIAQVKAAAGGAADAVLDCPPGASCAVTEAVRGADLCLLVTEPTPLGLSDLAKALGLVRWLGVPHAVVLNRCDLAGTDVKAFCRDRGVPVLLELPYAPDVARACAEGRLVAAGRGRWPETFEALAARITTAGIGHQPPAAGAQEPLAGEECHEPIRNPKSEIRNAFVQVVVVSGKGGTGKTSLAASLAALAPGIVAADADVDAANLHLLLHPDDGRCVPFSGASLAVVDAATCRGCGVCADACRFGAVRVAEHATVDPFRCEGCGLCAAVCPLSGAAEGGPIRLVPRLSGHARAGLFRGGALVRGELVPGGEASGKLVTLVRRLAAEEAVGRRADRLLIDASPGTGCPVNASITGCDLAVAVTEPTAAALHDLTRVLDLAAWFGVPTVAVLNKADLSPAVAGRVREVLRARGVEVVGEVPFDRAVPESLARGQAPALGPGRAGEALRRVAHAILDRAADIQARRRPGRNATAAPAPAAHTGKEKST
jgi:MinD superfamily P-loop ATPase